MAFNRICQSLIVLSLGLHSASALTQSNGASGGVDLQSPSALPVVATSRPSDLPLAPGEFLKPFVNGCAIISRTQASAAAPNTNTNWYGDCRFGLAHGDGIEQAVATNFRMRRRYQYGVPVGGTDSKSPFPYSRTVREGVYMTLSLANGGGEAVSIRSPDLNVPNLRAADPVSLTVEEPGQLAYDTFAPVALPCAPSGKVDWKGLNVSAADNIAADADCERYQASLGSNRMPRNALLVSVGLDVVAYIEHTHQTKPSGGVASPKEVSGRFCAGGAKSADCDRVLQEVLQPYAARIQAIIDGQRQQYAHGLPWLAARFAPLEAVRRQKWRALAARYAAEAPPPLAPVKLLGPVAPRKVDSSNKGRQ